MANLLEAEYLAVTLSLEDWVGLVNGHFYNCQAEGFYKNGVLQIKLGEVVLTGAIINYAILLDGISWGVGDPVCGEYAGLLEEFLITYSGTAKLTFNAPGVRPYTVYIVDGKYVTEEEYDQAAQTSAFACSPVLVEATDTKNC